MNKTDNFFVIHNYNYVPLEILEYPNNYIVFDASTNLEIRKELEKYGIKFRAIANTGHNLSTYFTFFYENYNHLPDVMCLTKGHMIGRHCSKEYFDRVYNNRFFTFLYEDKNVKLKSGINSLVDESMYLEINNSWYVNSPNHPHRYFDNYNRLLKFVYQDPIIPEYCLFAPGGCYIVTKEQVYLHSDCFYKNLNKIMTYGLIPSFPSEAHQIERMLPIFFTSKKRVNSWMDDEMMFEEMIKKEEMITKENDEKNKTKKNIIERIVSKL